MLIFNECAVPISDCEMHQNVYQKSLWCSFHFTTVIYKTFFGCAIADKKDKFCKLFSFWGLGVGFCPYSCVNH